MLFGTPVKKSPAPVVKQKSGGQLETEAFLAMGSRPVIPAKRAIDRAANTVSIQLQANGAIRLFPSNQNRDWMYLSNNSGADIQMSKGPFTYQEGRYPKILPGASMLAINGWTDEVWIDFNNPGGITPGPDMVVTGMETMKT